MSGFVRWECTRDKPMPRNRKIDPVKNVIHSDAKEVDREPCKYYSSNDYYHHVLYRCPWCGTEWWEIEPAGV